MESFKVFLLLFSFAMISSVISLSVEDAWKNYQSKPLPPGTPSWVEKIANFETFKKRWDEARAFNDKYGTTEDAWKAYKVLFRLNYAGDEDVMRFGIFKPRWEARLAHNERYARGEVYYPQWIDVLMAETEEEAIAREKLPLD